MKFSILKLCPCLVFLVLMVSNCNSLDAQNLLKSSQDSTKIKMFQNYIKWTYNYASQKKFDSSSKYAERAISLAKQFDNHDYEAFANTSKAIAQFWQVNLPEAKTLLQQNIERQNVHDTIKSLSFSVLGDISIYEEDYKKALPYLIEAEKLLLKSPFLTRRDSLDLARNYVRMADIHKYLENFSQAHSYYDKAVHLHSDQNNKSYVLFFKAELYKQENQLKRAIAITKDAVEMVDKEKKGTIFLPTYYLGLSRSYATLKQGDSAVYYGEQGLKDNEDCQLGLLYLAVAEGFVLQNNHRQAVNYLTRGLKFVHTQNSKVQLHKDLSAAYSRLGEYKNALIHNDMYLKLKDSLDALKIKQEIVAITEKYESNKKQLEIEKLNSQNAQSNFVITQQRSQLLLTTLGLLLALAVLGSIVYFYFQQKRQKNLLFIKNVQLAKELRMKEISEVHQNPISIKQKQESSSIDQVQRNKIGAAIDHLIKTQFYLDSDMSLSKMAKILETNTSYLSRIINEDYQKTFANFVNELRLTHTLKSLETQPNYRNLTIDHIAEKSGFSSSSTFYNAFKKFTGLTPSYYIKKRILQRL